MTEEITPDLIRAFARKHDVRLGPDDLADIATRVETVVRMLDQLPATPTGTSLGVRDPGRAPTCSEDPYNAIIRLCDVRGAASGPLRGMRIGVKDNIAVAGIPMTEGKESLSATPVEDAVVVERLLAAGADIVAKTNVEPSDFGMVLNPLDPAASSGGSSSGSAAVVVGGLVEAALGADQGGSIRVPAAFCGIVGLKPTHGLVPSHGLAYCDHTIDAIGPMTRTARDNALLLETMAGHDPRDPQWVRATPTSDRYLAAAELGATGLRVGVIDEAVTIGCSDATLRAFRDAVSLLESEGVAVRPVSVPLWQHASTIWLAVVTAATTAMADSLGQGFSHLGRIDLDRFARLSVEYRTGRRGVGDNFGGPSTPIVFEFIKTLRDGLPLARAQNLRLDLAQQIDAALEGVDLLVTPTVPFGPRELTPPDETEPRGSAMANVCPFNLSGHPALTLPAGRRGDALTTGFQIVGRRFDERSVYRAAFALESAIDGDGTT